MSRDARPDRHASLKGGRKQFYLTIGVMLFLFAVAASSFQDAWDGITSGVVPPLRRYSGVVRADEDYGAYVEAILAHAFTGVVMLVLIAIIFHKMREGLRKGAAAEARDERAD